MKMYSWENDRASRENEDKPHVLAGRLEIRKRDGVGDVRRLTFREIEVRLDGHVLPPTFHFSFYVDVDDVVRATIGFYPSEIDVDCQVLAFIKELQAKPE